MNESKRRVLVSLIEILFLTAFWEIGFLVNNPMLYMRCIYLFFLTLYGISYWKKAIINYRLCISITLLAFVSCLASNIVNGQPFAMVLTASIPYFGLSAFSIPFINKLTYKETKKILILLSIIFCFLYMFQWAVYPKEIFPMAVSEWYTNENYDFYRGRMAGSACGYFLLVCAWNDFILGKRKMLNLMLMGLAFLPIMIQGFRSLVAISLVSLIFMVPFVTQKFGKSVIFLIILTSMGWWSLFNVQIVSDKYQEMLVRQEGDQTFDNSDYVRYASLYYYYQVAAEKPIQFVTGGGMPVEEGGSEYYRKFNMVEDIGLFWNDLGIVGLCLIIGVPAVLLLIWLSIRIMLKCKDPEVQYLRFIAFILLGGSIMTSMEIFRNENFVYLALYAYAAWIYNKENNYFKETN